MKNMRLLLLLLSIAVVVPVFAANPESFKEWEHSPQGYFMTAAERTQWAAITNDADAEKFVTEFLAKRGPNFVADVDKAASMADKYLTVGKTPGSKTMRGKVVIVLGPPSAINVEQKVLTGDRRLTSGGAEGAGGGGGGGRGGAAAPPANTGEIKMMLRGELKELDAQAAAAIKRTTDRTTKLHLENVRHEISDILKPKASASGGASADEEGIVRR